MWVGTACGLSAHVPLNGVHTTGNQRRCRRRNPTHLFPRRCQLLHSMTNQGWSPPTNLLSNKRSIWRLIMFNQYLLWCPYSYFIQLETRICWHCLRSILVFLWLVVISFKRQSCYVFYCAMLLNKTSFDFFRPCPNSVLRHSIIGLLEYVTEIFSQMYCCRGIA